MDILDQCISSLWKDDTTYQHLLLYKVVHKWETLMDPLMNENTYIQSINPPLLTIYVGHPIWKQHIMMQKYKLLSEINKLLKDKKIEEFNILFTSLEKIQYWKKERAVIKSKMMEELKKDEKIPFDTIPLEEEIKQSIQKKVEHFQEEALKHRIIKLSEQAKKKELYLKKQGIVRCPVCHHYIEGEYCEYCERKKEEELHKKIAMLIEKEPWSTYQEVFQKCCCSYQDFSIIKKRITSKYGDMIFKGSTDWHVLCMYTMLLSGKTDKEIDREFVNKKTEALRKSYMTFVEKYKIDSK